VILFAALFNKLPALLIWGLKHMWSSFIEYQALQFLILLIALLYTTLNLGASFPAAIAAFVNASTSIGRRVGKVYAFNTFGAILGSFLAGFALMPSFGTENTLWIAFFLNLIIGVAVLISIKSMDRLSWIWAVSCLTLFFLLPRWDQSVLISGIYSTAYMWTSGPSTASEEVLPESLGHQILRGYDSSLQPDLKPEPPLSEGVTILFLREGLTATISVIETARDIAAC
jgi:MFS family permease